MAIPFSSAKAKNVDFAMPRSGTCCLILRRALRTAGALPFGSLSFESWMASFFDPSGRPRSISSTSFAVRSTSDCTFGFAALALSAPLSLQPDKDGASEKLSPSTRRRVRRSIMTRPS
jgi:hypothetical protein